MSSAARVRRGCVQPNGGSRSQMTQSEVHEPPSSEWSASEVHRIKYEHTARETRHDSEQTATVQNSAHSR